MKKFVVLLLAIATFACSSKQERPEGTLEVSGEVRFPADTGKIYLQILESGEYTTIQETSLDGENKYSFYVAVEQPDFYRLNFFGKQEVSLILSDADVQVVADGDRSSGFYEVKGSKDTDYFIDITKQNKKFKSDEMLLNQEFMTARRNGAQDEAISIRNQYIRLEAKYYRDMKASLWEMGPSIAAIFGTNYLKAEQEFSFLDSLSNRFNEALPNSKYTRQLNAQVEGMRKLAVGSPAPEIMLPNPDGEMISLSSLKGQYVLIDFWAGWCRPCRIENPNVVRMYDKYSDKGFEIFGVSLDRKREQWIQAIADDGLMWKHGSDLNYFNSEAARTYNINAIPATYLIDPDGKIAAKNLRGVTLENKLKEIFGS